MPDLQPTQAVDLIVLRVLPTALRCRELAGSTVTYRKQLPSAVPGVCLSVDARHRWCFRRTDLIAGPLQRSVFSTRALANAGFCVPTMEAEHLQDPAETDPRLDESARELEGGDLLGARGLLLDVLEEQPASLLAHAGVADVLSRFRQAGGAAMHFTAAVRLGLAGLDPQRDAPLDARCSVDRALLGALVGRARLLSRLGRPVAAAADLQRALALDPSDALLARRELDDLAVVPQVGQAGARP